jgi:hypothetical protein
MSREASAGGSFQIAVASFVPFELTFKGKSELFDLERISSFIEKEMGFLVGEVEDDGVLLLEISSEEKCYLEAAHDEFLERLANAGFSGGICIHWYETDESCMVVLRNGHLFHTNVIQGFTTQLAPSFDGMSPEQESVEGLINDLKERIGTWQPANTDPIQALNDFTMFLVSARFELDEKAKALA